MTFTTRWINFPFKTHDLLASGLFGGYPGMDFIIGAVNPAIQILHGQNYYSNIQIYGPTISVILIPILQIANSLRICRNLDQIEGYYRCGIEIYTGIDVIVIIGFGFLLYKLTQKYPQERILVLIMYLTFLTGISGSFGIQRGNLDLILALIIGFLFLQFFRSIKKGYASYLIPILVGLCGGLVAGAKVFLILFSLLLTLKSEKPRLSLSLMILSYLFFSYLPAIYHAPADLITPIRIAFASDQGISLSNSKYLIFNHSLSATGSFFTDCLAQNTCDTNQTIQFLNYLFCLIIFLIPLITTRQLRLWIKENIKSLPRTILKVINFKFKLSDATILVLLTYSYGIVNLIPKAAYGYRLFYGLPIIAVLLVKSNNAIKARRFLILSVIFLLLNGLWINLKLNPYGMDSTDARLMNILYLIHVFLMIKSAILLSFPEKVSGGDLK
jgi:hypothetical protein